MEPPSARAVALEGLLSRPTSETWVEVMFTLENKKLDSALNEFNEAAAHFYGIYSSVQAILNAKTTPDVSESCQVVPFILSKLQKKKKVNCLGSALAALLIARANNIPCRFCSSENHCWIVLDDGTVVDVMDNLKAAKKSKKPLSIYANSRYLDDFSLCMILIVNRNDLSDDEELYILSQFQAQLMHSWEFSKLHSLGNKLCRMDVIPDRLLLRDSKSLGMIADRALHSINEEENAVQALVEMGCLLERVSFLAQEYSVDSDWWLNPKGSFLHICEEFTKEFTDNLEFESDYESWLNCAIVLAQNVIPSKWEKFAKSVPRLSGKRRRRETHSMFV